MALQGTIETFALPDVLRLLATSNKTGKLAVDGDRGLGALWVDDGDIVASELDLGSHPSTGSTNVTEGLFQLLRFERGEFVFTSDDTPASSDGRLNVESSIAMSTEMLTELNEITNNVPGVSSHVALRPELDADGVTLSAEQWRVLSSVGSGKSVADIASTFSFGELDAMRRIDDLVNEGVIDISATPADAAAPAMDEAEDVTTQDEPAGIPVVEESSFEEAAPEEAAFEEAAAEEGPFEQDAASDAFDPENEVAADDPFAAATEDDESIEAPVAEADNPFAPVAESDDPFAPAVEADVADPFASPQAEAEVDAFAPAPVSETPAPDPFAPAEPEIEAIDHTEAQVAEESNGAEFDPFAPAAEDAADDSAGSDPFAPAAGVAAGATGGVLHDVFGNPDSEVDASWEPSVEETVSQAPTEWPAPNDTVSDADAPWSDEAASQLPPPPAAASDPFAPAEEAASQLPPPPAMAGDAGIEDGISPEGVEAFDAPAPLSAELDQTVDSELPPPPAFDAPEAEVAGVPSFPDAPPAPEVQSVASESNDMARQLASLSPSAARAVANAAKAETPEARDEALAEVEAEDSSVDRSLLLRFLGKSDKKES